MRLSDEEVLEVMKCPFECCCTHKDDKTVTCLPCTIEYIKPEDGCLGGGERLYENVLRKL